MECVIDGMVFTVYDTGSVCDICGKPGKRYSVKHGRNWYPVKGSFCSDKCLYKKYGKHEAEGVREG